MIFLKINLQLLVLYLTKKGSTIAYGEDKLSNAISEHVRLPDYVFLIIGVEM